MNKFYVYVHYRLTDNIPFYVGKGYGKRANLIARRSAYWTNVYKKHGRRVEFVMKDLAEDEAFELEMFVIQTIKDRGIVLTNFTNGGEGSSGYKASEEAKAKMSIARKGNTNALGYKHTDETKKILSEKSKGNQYGKLLLGYKHGPAFGAAQSLRLKGNTFGTANKVRKHTIEARANISAGAKGRVITDAYKLVRKESGLKTKAHIKAFCSETGILSPGTGYCNVDKVKFNSWLHNKSLKCQNI